MKDTNDITEQLIKEFEIAMRNLRSADGDAQKESPPQNKTIMINHYAKVWPCGLAVRDAGNNDSATVNVVNVYAFDSASERDAAIYNYDPPNHCPQAFAESVKARDEDVIRIKRLSEGAGDHFNRLEAGESMA